MKSRLRLDDAPDVLKVTDVSLLLRVGRNQIYEAIRRGEIPYFRIGRTIRVSKVALMRMISANQQDGNATDAATQAVQGDVRDARPVPQHPTRRHVSLRERGSTENPGRIPGTIASKGWLGKRV